MAQQIAALKQGLGQGQMMGSSQTSGVASSGWGIGSSPYAVAPAEAPNRNSAENREGNQTQGEKAASDFEPLYSPEEFGHNSKDEQVRGKIDFSKPPEKIEEIRSAPETQQAMAEYSGAISAYTEGEETAIQREEVPVEYQELVRQYFDELKEGSKPQKPAESSGEGKTKKKAKKKSK